MQNRYMDNISKFISSMQAISSTNYKFILLLREGKYIKVSLLKSSIAMFKQHFGGGRK